MPTIGLVNQKGGVGKTTTAVNLAACLAAAKKRTLLLDVDPQGNAGSAFGVSGEDYTSYDCLTGASTIADAKQATMVEGLDVVRSSTDLYGFDVEYQNQEGCQYRLRELLQPASAFYDYVILDAPPSLSLLTLNVLAAADYLIIPVQCEYYALEGLSQLIDTIDRVRQELNPKLQILGIVMTMFDARLNIAQQVVAEVRQHFPDQVFDTQIARSVRLSEAPSHGMPIIIYDFRSTSSRQYISLAEEVIRAAKKASTRERA